MVAGVLSSRACEHAKERGYAWWKAFTTGKSLHLGGIPHDVYGMTTHGVRQYALGIQETYGLVGSNCTKVVTGGPDGDLGRCDVCLLAYSCATWSEGCCYGLVCGSVFVST